MGVLTLAWVFAAFACASYQSNIQPTSPELRYSFVPDNRDSWWKMYVKSESNYSNLPYFKIKESVSLRIEADFNDTLKKIHIFHAGDGETGVGGFLSSDRGLNASKQILQEEAKVKTEDKTRNSKEEDADTPEVVLARRFVSVAPPFVPSSSRRVKNEQCIRDSELFLQELQHFKLWALRMHDSSAKMPSGLLNGNVNLYGDIDQCLNVRSERQDRVVKGRYCLTTMAIQLSDPDRPTLQHVRELLLSHGMFRSNLDDPGHRVPRFSSIHWALCVPASCSASDVQTALSDLLHEHMNGTGISLQVYVTPEMCQVKEDKINLPASTIVVGAFFMFVVFLAITATACDPDWTSSKQDMSIGRSLLQAFSLRKNTLKLVSLVRPSEDIESVHGIRALNAFLLLIAHKCMALFFKPYLNRTTMAEHLGKPWTVFARGACLYTDPFIMISGLLTSYSFYKILQRKNKLDIPREYISRLMRLLPNLVALMLFCTFILPWMGYGPLWNQVVRHHSDICKITWWRNLLFIHNYFGFENMCLTHTHHIGIDTQLFLFSPVLVYLVWKWPRLGFSTLAAIAAVSTGLRYSVTYSKQLSHFVVFGSSVRQLFKTADLSYTLPAHRASVYVIGIALGYGLRYCGRDFKIKKMYLILGWISAAVCFYFSLVSPAHMASRHYVYNATEAASFGAFAPITWCLITAWVIFVSYTGHGGLLSQILSWRGFLVTTRLSYALYLIQFPIFFYTVGTNRVSQMYSIFLLIDVPELILIVVGSVLLTLLFDLPFQNIRTMLLKKPK